MVGTFYAAPSPTAKAFVEVGQVVKPGDTLSKIAKDYTAKNLEKLGFEVQYKVIDFALLQKRMDVFAHLLSLALRPQNPRRQDTHAFVQHLIQNKEDPAWDEERLLGREVPIWASSDMKRRIEVLLGKAIVAEREGKAAHAQSLLDKAIKAEGDQFVVNRTAKIRRGGLVLTTVDGGFFGPSVREFPAGSRGSGT